MFCTQCGAQLASNSRFCAQCGSPVDLGAAQGQKAKKHKNQPSVVEETQHRGKISIEHVFQDPSAQPFVEPLQNVCGLIADRITDYLPYHYYMQFLAFMDLLNEIGEGFENGEFEQSDFLNVYSSVINVADFSETIESYREGLNAFPEFVAQQYNYLLESLVNNGVDDSIMQYAFDENRIEVEAEKIRTTLAKPAKNTATKLKAVVAAYPGVIKLLERSRADYDALMTSEETMDNSEFLSYAQGIISLAISPAIGAMSLFRTYNRNLEKSRNKHDKVQKEINAFLESMQTYYESLFETFDQLHQTAYEQFDSLNMTIQQLYAKPFLLAQHTGAIDDWETLGNGVNALVGEGIYGALIEGYDESFDEVIARSRELIQEIREETQS